MQVRQTIEVNISLKVIYVSADEYRVALVAVAPYANGERTATLTEDIEFPPLDLLDACNALIDERGEDLARRAMAAASEAEGVARRRGELS